MSSSAVTPGNLVYKEYCGKYITIVELQYLNIDSAMKQYVEQLNLGKRYTVLRLPLTHNTKSM